MKHLTVHPIGEICNSQSGTLIQVDRNYITALQGLEGFSHINVLWWFSEFQDEQSRSLLQTKQPYKGAPGIMGTFATRSPVRPNPIALTTAEIIRIDMEEGIIHIAFIDANHGSPVLDIKPYTPSFDRVEAPCVPAWCSGWPKSTEASGAFNWEEVFNF